MENTTISELTQEATSLGDNDLILVSTTNDGTNFVSKKMKGSVLKASDAQCQFSSDAVKTACEAAMSSSTTSVNVKGVFIDPSKSDGFLQRQDTLSNYTLLYDSVVTMWIDGSPITESVSSGSIHLSINGKTIGHVSFEHWTISSNHICNNSGSQSFYLKKGTVITITCNSSININTTWSICPLG